MATRKFDKGPGWLVYDFPKDHVSEMHFENSYIFLSILFMGWFSLRAIYFSETVPNLVIYSICATPQDMFVSNIINMYFESLICV